MKREQSSTDHNLAGTTEKVNSSNENLLDSLSNKKVAVGNSEVIYISIDLFNLMKSDITQSCLGYNI